MSHTPQKRPGKSEGVIRQERTVLQAWQDAYRRSAMMLCDKVPLAIGFAVVYGFELYRHILPIEDGKTKTLLGALMLVAEGGLFVSLVVPKAIHVADELVHAVGGFLESVAVVLHNVWRAVRTGKRSEREQNT